MKFKFNKKNAGSEGLRVATATGGVLLSKGAMSLVPIDKRSALITGGAALASVLAIASIGGEGTVETAVKGVLTGVAIDQVVSTITEAVKPSITETTEDSTKGEKFVAAMFGLNGADNGEPFVVPASAWDSPMPKAQNHADPFTVDNVVSV